MSHTRMFEALNWASSFLTEKGREPKAAEFLLMHRLALTRSQLLAVVRDEMKETDERWFEKAVETHASGVPIQHIIGSETFYGRRFSITPDVLIPRPETEELIFELMTLRESLFEKRSISYCDVGTGSGAIAITLDLEDLHSQVTAVDLSSKALKVAKENADALGAQVVFEQGDLLTPFLGKQCFDIVVSNPPYIPTSTVDTLDSLVRDHEPRLALDGGEDGLDPYKVLAKQLPSVLSSQFLIGFEIGEGQGQAVCNLLQEAFNGSIETKIKNDMNHRERLVFGWQAT